MSDPFQPIPRSEFLSAHANQNVWFVGSSKELFLQTGDLLKALNHNVFAIPIHDVAEKLDEEKSPSLLLVETDASPVTISQINRQLKECTSIKDIPKLLLCDRNHRDALLEGLKTGADDFIPLPLSTHEFFVRVRTHLTLGSMREQTQQARSRSMIISNIIVGFNQGFAIHDALSPVLNDIAGHLDCDCAGLWLIDEDLTPADWIADSGGLFSFRPSLPNEALENMQRTKEPIAYSLQAFSGVRTGADGYLMLLPIVDRERLLAVLAVMNRSGHPVVERNLVSVSIVNDILAVTISRYNHLLAVDRSTRRLQRELENLGRMQQMLLPQRLPDVSGIEMDAFYFPAEAAGGDYYDVIPLTEDHVAFIVADVSGHGAPAAMNMGIARSILHTVSLSQQTEPQNTVRFVNKLLCRLLGKGVYITMFYAVLNIRTREFSWCNAGHVPGILQHGDGGHTQLLGDPTNGPALGWWSDTDFECETVVLHPGDRVILYTDGVTEALNPRGEELTQDALLQCLADSSKPTCKETIETMSHTIEDHIQDAEIRDDVTMLVFSIRKTA